jgi:hypothetical protein
MDADEFPGLSGSEVGERCFDAAKKFIRGVIERASATGN